MSDHNDTDGSYAQLILPTLRRIRTARRGADALACSASDTGLVTCAERARTTITALDQRLRAAGLYDLAQPDLLEKDAPRMAQACQLIDETRRQLGELAARLRAECGDEAGQAALAELVATLDAQG